MELSDYYLISGIFFQETVGIGLGYGDEGDLTAIAQSRICEYLYIGALQRDPTSTLGAYSGDMLDSFGRSRLELVVISEDRLSFDKCYENRRSHPHKVHYSFERRKGAEWFGNYSIPALNRQGPTRCVLNPITQDFFRHDLMARFYLCEQKAG